MSASVLTCVTGVPQALPHLRNWPGMPRVCAIAVLVDESTAEPLLSFFCLCCAPLSPHLIGDSHPGVSLMVAHSFAFVQKGSFNASELSAEGEEQNKTVSGWFQVHSGLDENLGEENGGPKETGPDCLEFLPEAVSLVF